MGPFGPNLTKRLTAAPCRGITDVVTVGSPRAACTFFARPAEVYAMFRLIHRPSHKRTLFSPRPVRLLLEPLEDRNSPSTITLNVAYAANHHVILSGQVTAGGWGAHTDSEGSGVTVQISGAASG